MLLYTPPKTSSIPLIDLSSSFSDAVHDRVRVAEEIHRAARDRGFFYITNHRVAPEVVDRALTAAAKFFALPLEQKRAIAMARGEARGYEQSGSQVLDDGSPADLKEAYSFAADLPPDHVAARDATPMWEPNRWPPGLSGFREAMLQYHRVLRALGLHVLRLIALSLDMPEDSFEEPYRFANPTARIHRYPPQPGDAAFNQLGAGAHTDWGGITLLAQDEAGGLEVQGADGTWLRAQPIPGTFVVNLGDLMARWTNDVYRSTFHRVMNNLSGRERYSIAFFLSPAYHALVEPLPTCRTAGEQPKYPPCTAGEHVAQKRLAAYGAR
jgi:isopenicillin N synthase-like dioxygenase